MPEPVRVLCISSHTGSITNVRPEAEWFIGLQRAGIEMTVMTEQDSVYADRMRAAGVRIVPLDIRRKYDLHAIRAIRAELRERRHHVVHLFYNKAISNGIVASLEEALASLEGGRFGFAYGSGMAAIAGTMQLVRAGDHVVVADDLYGGSYRLFSQVLPEYGVRFTFADATKPEEFAKAVEPETKMLWIETPTNPLLRLVDIAACAEIARSAEAMLVVDNTFATPLLQNPLALGADVVVHSTTKYIGGHSDVIGGAVVLNDEEAAQRLQFTRNVDHV